MSDRSKEPSDEVKRKLVVFLRSCESLKRDAATKQKIKEEKSCLKS